METIEDFTQLDCLDFIDKDSWVPDHTAIQNNFRDMPFKPFVRMDKVGKYCDFVSTNSKYNASMREDDEGFKLVEKNKYNNPKKQRLPNTKNQVVYTLMTYNVHISAKNKKNQRKPVNRYNNKNYNKTKFINAGSIHSEWKVVDDVAIPNLEKKKLTHEITDMTSNGEIFRFETKFHRINSKKPWVLPKVQKMALASPDTFEDPYLLHQFYNPSPEDEGKNLFFMTDNLLLSLCVIQKSLFPWNMRVMKTANKFILYTYSSDQSAGFINLQTHNENIQEHLPDDETELGRLCVETTLIQQNFLRACTDQNAKESASEEIIGDNVIIDMPVMYKYKRIELGGQNVVYTRIPIESYVEDANGKKNYVLVKSLNVIQGTQWLKNWESNKSLQLNTFYKNNKSVVCKWLVQAILTGCDSIKIAIAMRTNSKEREEHKIIGVEDVKISELMNVFQFNFETMLCSLNVVLDSLNKTDENGKYIINKVPFKQNFSVLKIQEEESDEDSEENY